MRVDQVSPLNFQQSSGHPPEEPDLLPIWNDTSRTNEDTVNSPLSLDGVAQENSHIIGPAVTNDTQVLADYLSSSPNSSRALRMIRPMSSSSHPTSLQRPVMFTLIQKRPVGIPGYSTPSSVQLQIVEKFLEPWADSLIELYFEKSNVCFPILDKSSFKEQYRKDKDRISPALLTCLYAHAMIYWRYSLTLSSHRCPDIRFVWNLAVEALYSELHLSPGISTIIAALINIGGRPTTSLIGNGVQLGSAVSLAHSLGLNRNPLHWRIPSSEKDLRIKVWWTLIIHDSWCSLAYGTPPRISSRQHDVPVPEVGHLCESNSTDLERAAAHVFVALASLTTVLETYLQNVYEVGRNEEKEAVRPSPQLELELNQWIEGLSGNIRKTIIRGNDLRIPGSANLRLAYLSTRLLLRRIELDMDKDDKQLELNARTNRLIQVRRSAEDIVLFVQELQVDQLGDFWLPVSAFMFTSTITFLLRCALEVENESGLAHRSVSLDLASDLINALQCHRDNHGWDLGDICLAQYSDIVEELLSSPPSSNLEMPFPDLSERIMSNIPVVDEMFPSLWDMFRNN